MKQKEKLKENNEYIEIKREIKEKSKIEEKLLIEKDEIEKKRKEIE